VLPGSPVSSVTGLTERARRADGPGAEDEQGEQQRPHPAGTVTAGAAPPVA
jgi:hypothetical protein